MHRKILVASLAFFPAVLIVFGAVVLAIRSTGNRVDTNAQTLTSAASRKYLLTNDCDCALKLFITLLSNAADRTGHRNGGLNADAVML